MYTSIVGFLPALILYCSEFAYTTGQNHCTRVVKNTCMLRWSVEHQEFYATPVNAAGHSQANEYLPGERSESYAWCVLNEERRSVQIRFDFRVAGKTVDLQNCPLTHNPRCKSICFAVDFYEQIRIYEDTVLNLNKVRLVLQKDNRIVNNTVFNASAISERVSRYIRQSNGNSRTQQPLSRFHHRFPSRRHKKRRRCKKCVGRRMRRRRLLKEIASEFLLELAKESRRLRVSNYSSLTRLLRQNAKLSSQIDKLRNNDASYKRMTSADTHHSDRIHLSYISRNSDDDSSDKKRIKRNLQSSVYSTSDPNFCSTPAQKHSSAERKESGLPIVKQINKLGRWTPSTFPIIIEGEEPNFLLDMSNFATLDESVLQHLVITVEFLSQIRDQQFTQTLSTLVNISKATIIKGNITTSYVNNATIVAATIGGGSGLLLLLVAIIFLCHRKSIPRCDTESNSRKCECHSISESENCLSATESVEERQTWKTSSVCSSEQAGNLDHTKNKTVVDSNIIMLEYKKSNRDRNKDRVDRKSALANAKSTNKATSQSTCQHNAANRGSSRHDRCIVCQIAGKPHKPIINAQEYASQAFPSAKRHTQESIGATFNDKTSNGSRAKSSDDLGGSRNSTSSLPWTIRLPDGEERYRGGQEMHSSLMSERKTYPVCVKAPPNRTIYSCEALPFAPFNNNSPKLKVKGGYSGPSPSVPKHVGKGYASPVSNGSNNSRSSLTGNGCVCRYMMNQMDDPPPEYSDVVS